MGRVGYVSTGSGFSQVNVAAIRMMLGPYGISGLWLDRNERSFYFLSDELSHIRQPSPPQFQRVRYTRLSGTCNDDTG